MHWLLGGAGILALVALAFGERAAVVLAQVVVIGAVLLVLAFAYDIYTAGSISDHIRLPGQ